MYDLAHPQAEYLKNKSWYDEAAKIACCSVFYFQRVFSYVTGVSPSEYIRRRRMIQAAFELQTENAKVQDVGAKYDYVSPASFNRAFQAVHWLWNLAVRDERYTSRDIPPEKRNFNKRYTSDTKLVALFEKSVKYQLIETYGLDCFTETADGLLFELGFTNREFLLGWLLGFGDKVKVLEPSDIAEDIKTTAENIFSRYK